MTKLTFLEATNAQHQEELVALDRKLFNFYNSEKASCYWSDADNSNFTWTPETHPYHLHLKSLVKSGSKVVELGCGSAHAYRNLRDLGIDYTGIEWSESQARLNAETFPDAKFISGSFYKVPLPDSSFDVAISLFTLEHTVYPHTYLQEMIRLVKPNGIIAILCPDFRGAGGMNSFVYGTSSLELREKLKMGRLWDTLLHLYEREFAFPQKIRKEYSNQNKDKKFLIYSNPKCIEGKCYSDTDAIYFVGQPEIQTFLEESNCQILKQRSHLMNSESGFCYMIAKKST